MNIFDSLARSKSHFPDKPAVVFRGGVLTYGELHSKVSALSAGLARLGLGRGDRAALFLPNVPEFVLSYYAIARLGAIAVSLNVMLKREEVAFILGDCEAKLLVTTRRLLSEVPEAAPGLRRVICVDEPAGESSLASLFLEGAPPPKASLEPDEGAAILYTSGTTGKPKGVLLTHANLISNVYATNHHTRMGPADRLICYLPLFHCFGQNFIMNACVNAGATLVLHERFVPEEILESVERQAVSMFFGVPAVYIRLLPLADLEKRLGRVRYFFTAAAPMPQAVARQWRDRLGQTVWEGYGLTETSPFATYNHDFSYREGSVGTPIENVEVKIVDDSGDEVGPGGTGEIAIRGPNVMKGYYRRPEETAQAIKNGWFFSGDIGSVDEDGYLYLVDRAKDMINVSGFKVWPREVEDLLARHPAVSEAAVVGVPDPIAGEAVKAFVVLKPDAKAEERELIEFCRSRIATYKAPRYVEFIDALPRNPSGKILKRELRARPSGAASPGSSG